MLGNDLDDLLPVTGLVHLPTDLGHFLEVQGRPVFVPANFMMLPTRRKLSVGEVVTVLVSRRFTEREDLVV